MYRKIMCTVDITDFGKAERILLRAAALLDDGGQMLIFHAVEPLPSYLMADLPPDQLAGAVRDADGTLRDFCLRANIPGTVEVRIGEPADAILDAAREWKAELIVLASHVPDFSNCVLGSTADRVVRHATCSVLVERRAS